MKLSSVVSVLAALLPTCHSFRSTDSPQDGDVPQSGYTTNHNFDPKTLSQYKISWTSTFNKAEFFYAKPLVYTPPGASHELVYVVSNQNIVRVLDGMTGEVVVERTLDPPFQASDSDCGDISNTIGIIGTPIIDTEADLMYFWSKSYISGRAGAQGVANGNWKLYAVRVSDLSDAPGFPISIQGLNAYNDRSRYIISGTLNQRPGLAMLGNTIITGFGSHCDNFNFTGYLITASKTPGVGITDIQAMVASPGAPVPQALDLYTQRNGKSAIWQAGFGLAIDAPNNRVFFATGNGQGRGQLMGDMGEPVSGKTYLSTLENSVANYAVNPNSGKLTQQDWFCPTDYDHLNGADKDLGSSGVALLDSGTFSGGGVNRIAIAAGKRGTIIIMDADNLGGFKNGPGKSDDVLQIISPPGGSFFSGVASYPLEGGYIYFVPTDDNIYAYKFEIAYGRPHFTLAGKSRMVFAGRGAPKVTSLNGQPGTGIVWLSDINQGVVAYNAVPVNGVLEPYIFPATGRLNKFQRPSFGNARVYTVEQNQVLAIGLVSASPTSSSNPPRSTSSSNISKRKHRPSRPSTFAQSSSTLPPPPAGDRISIDWTLNWVNAAPDGHMRPMIGINGQWPNPPIVLNHGDTLVLNVYNGLGNESTSIHFHGIFQRSTTYDDGPTFATQCPILPGNSFTYEFTATQVGTYWYHSHHGGQYIDGLRGALIIKDPSPPYGKVDQDVTLTLSDHYHEEAPYLINHYQSADNTNNNGGVEPVPNSNLMNDTQNLNFTMIPGQTNLFRVINMGSGAGQYLQFDGHNMTVVEIDGQYVEPYNVSQLFIAVAQRYSVIVKSKMDSSQNYAIVATMDANMFYESNSPLDVTVSGWLIYNETNILPAPFSLEPQPFDDTVFVPLDHQPLIDPPSQTIYMAADFGVDENGVTRGFLNGVTYVNQKIPTLYTVLSAPAEYQNNPTIYGTGSNPIILPYGAIIEISITNHDDRAHPFHLHGHAFQVIYRSDGGNLFPGLYDTPTIPMKRDVITVYAQGTATIRFVANNPGIQLFHCHTEWHVVSGMTATFIEAPTELVAQKPYIPASHRDTCDKQNIPLQGNAAGNTADWLDLTGANTVAPTDNWGALTNPLSDKGARSAEHELR